MAFFSPAFSSSISQPKVRQEGFHLPSPSPSNGNPPSPSSFDLFLPHPSSHPHADSSGGGGGGGSGSSLPTAFSRTGGGAMDFGDELAAIMSSSSGAGNSGNNGSSNSPALSHERSTHAGTPPYDHSQHHHHGHGANASNGYRPTHNIFDISAPPSAHYTSGSGGGYGPGAHAFSLPHTSHRPELPPISQPASLATSHLHGPHGLGAGHSPSPFDPHPHPALHHHTPHHLQHPHFLSSSGPSSGTPPLSAGAGGRDAFPAHFNSTIPPLGTGAHHQPQHEPSLSESFHSYGGGPFSPASASSGGGGGERETPSPGTPALNSAVPPQQQQGGGGSRPPTGRMHSRHSQQRSPSRSRSRVRPGTASGVQGAAGSNANNTTVANGGNAASGAGPTRTTKGAAKRRDSFTAGPHQHHQFASASSSSAQNSLVQELGEREGGLASPSITSLSASPPSQSQLHHRPSAITIPGGTLLNNPNPNGPRGPASPLGIGVGGLASMSLNTPTGAGGQQGPPGGAPSSFSSLGSSLTPLTPIGLGPLGMGMNGPPPLGMMHPGSPLSMSMGMGVGGASGWFLPPTSSNNPNNHANAHAHGQNEFGLPTPESYGQHPHGPYGQFGTPSGGVGSMGISPKETTIHGMGGAMNLGGMGNLGGAGAGPGPGAGAGGGGRGGKSESPPQDPVSKQAAIVSEKRRRRRESHNAVERRRRDNINEKITELATLIPEVMLDPSAPASSANANNASADDAESRAAGKDEKSAGTGDEDGTPAPDGPSASGPGGKDKDNAAKDGGAGAVKANKGMILRKSVEYIRYLQQLVNAQAARNRDLETQLTRAGISPNPTTQGVAMPSLPGLSGAGGSQSPVASHALANGEDLNAQGLGPGLGGAQGDGEEQGMFGDDVLTLHTFGDDGSYLSAPGFGGAGAGFGALEPMDEGAEMEMDGMDGMDGLEGYGPGMDLAEDREREAQERSLSRPGGMMTNGNGKHLRHLRSASHARGPSASPGPSSALSDGDFESPEGSGEQVSANGNSNGSNERENQSPNLSQRERERGERGRKDRFGRIGGDVANRLVAVKEESASMEM